MALRKEPEHRYGSAAALADDLAAHAHYRPVRAHPETFGYLARKFARRHRTAIVVAALGLLVVAAFVIGLLA